MNDSNSNTTISLTFNHDPELQPSGVYPDGVPQTFSAADVAKVMEEDCRTAVELISGWGLDLDATITVTVCRPGKKPDTAEAFRRKDGY